MRALCVAAGAVMIAFAAAPAVAGEGCCWGGPTVIYAAPPVTVVVPPTGYVLDPSDALGPSYWVDQGAVDPRVIRFAVPTYSEGGSAFPFAYPYVRSYYGDAWFTAPPRFAWGYRPYGRHRHDGRRYGGYRYGRVHIHRAGIGSGNFAPPYGAYDYRPAPSARVIHVPPHPIQRDDPQE